MNALFWKWGLLTLENDSFISPLYFFTIYYQVIRVFQVKVQER